jgi:Zinc binding domain
VRCRACRTAGKPVDVLTVKALLRELALSRYEPAEYRFCDDSSCEIVYFAEAGPTFGVRDVRVPIWQKEPVGRRMICYCFGENEADMSAEIDRTGESLAIQRVRGHIAAGRCACEVRNPRGTCCLGDITAAVDRLRPNVGKQRGPQ